MDSLDRPPALSYTITYVLRTVITHWYYCNHDSTCPWLKEAEQAIMFTCSEML